MKNFKKELRFVYITCGSIEEAKRIGKILVKDNLVACVNILRDMISIFRWEEKIVEASELTVAKLPVETFCLPALCPQPDSLKALRFCKLLGKLHHLSP